MSVKTTVTAIADNIEKAGHFQGKPGEEAWPAGARMCLIANPAFAGAEMWSFLAALRAKIGDRTTTLNWNDSTPTDVVLATLREIAEEAL